MGFLEAMQEYHTSSESIIPTNGVETYDGYIAAKTLFDKQKNDVRGIVSASYDLTRGILKAANEFQINIPNDVTIISYDHIPPQKDELEVPFSQVGVPITDIAEKITETILEIIDGKEIDTPILLEPKINLPKLVINE
ncbi:MAG: substrate-binding domain-containing protein [Bacillaceae bacterium]|nr:substrate-binding domain-containing protein [Bacillaceae bacterium]